MSLGQTLPCDDPKDSKKKHDEGTAQYDDSKTQEYNNECDGHIRKSSTSAGRGRGGGVCCDCHWEVDGTRRKGTELRIDGTRAGAPEVCSREESLAQPIGGKLYQLISRGGEIRNSENFRKQKERERARER